MSSFYSELASTIFEEPQFQEDFNCLLKGGAGRVFPEGLYVSLTPDLHVPQLRRLLHTSVICALSENLSHRKTAYSIAVVVWAKYRGLYPGTKSITSLIFNRLANFPANELLKKIEEDEILEKPLLLSLECDTKELKNTVTIQSGTLVLTDFQKKFWNALKTHKSISLSAPTSAGKSFILKRNLLERLLENPKLRVVYIVPTRALITEVSIELSELLKERSPGNFAVLTAPLSWTQEDVTPVFVLTPERATVLLETSPEVSMDLVILDEAQKISDLGRGNIFHNVIESILERNPEVQFLFSMPNVKNTKLFTTQILDLKNAEEINEEESPVRQNYFTINPSVKGAKIKVKIGSELVEIGNLDKKFVLPEGAIEKTSALALAIGKDTQNIIYAHNPATCRNLALEMATQIGTKKEILGLIALSKYIAESLHPECALANTVLFGIAYHCGYLPSPIRLKIERLFKSGEIRFLACTSTLLEGVNLPAKNIFIHNMTAFRADFRNLAGRAGRLTKDFEGNIFLTQPKKQDLEMLVDESQVEVIPAIYQEIQNNLEIILEGMRSSEKKDYPISTINKLYCAYKTDRLSKLFERAPQPIPLVTQERLRDALTKMDSGIAIPWELIEKNPNFSPLAQSALYAQLKRKFIESLIPSHPLQQNNNLSLVMEILYEHLFSFDPKYRGLLTMLMRQWLTEMPFSQIIEKRVEYRKSVGETNVDNVIHDTMTSIEKDIRFTMSIGFKCYADMLKNILASLGQEALLEKFYPMSLALELGACNYTTISLITLGFSRYAAIEIQRHLGIPKQLDVQTVHAFLVKNKATILSSKGVLQSIKEEIAQLY